MKVPARQTERKGARRAILTRTGRSLRAIIIVLAVALAALSCSEPVREAAQTGTVRVDAPDNELQTILNRGVLRVGFTGDREIEYVDPETGERRGYLVDLVAKLSSDLGVSVEYVVTDEPNLVSGLVSGRYDVVAGTWDPVRARSASYTLPIVPAGPRTTDYIAFLVPQGHHDLRVFTDSWIRAQEQSGAIGEWAAEWGL